MSAGQPKDASVYDEVCDHNQMCVTYLTAFLVILSQLEDAVDSVQDDDGTRTLAYSLWQRAGSPEGRSDHFWHMARARLSPTKQPDAPEDPTIQEFNKRVDAESSSTFYGEVRRMRRIFLDTANATFGLTPTTPPEGILWHYTNGGTLASIVGGHSIWATRLDCLNDNSEYRLAFQLLHDIVKLRPIPVPPGNEGSFHEYLARRFSERPRYFEECFVTCFSTLRNDLSQWRAYGGAQGENGYAIGFNASDLVGHNSSLSLQRVEYREQCLRNFLSTVIEAMFTMYLEGSGWDSDRQELRSAWEDITYTTFERAAIRTFTAFKNSAFESENEWRLVCWRRPQASGVFKFSQNAAMLRQHLPLTADKVKEGSTLLPIREVLVGPSRHAEASAMTVQNLLASSGYPSSVKVSMSDTPLQST